MRDDGLKIGEKIDIHLGKGPYYRTVIDDFNFSDDTLIVPIPSYRGISIILRRDQNIRLFFYRDNGRYAVDARVVSLDLASTVKMARIKVTSEPQRQQRRESFRINAMLRAIIRPLSLGPFPKKPDPSEADEMEEAPTANLSATGLAVRVKGDYYVGERLYIQLFLDWPTPDTPPLTMLSEVRQVNRVEPGRDVFQLGLMFLNISAEDSTHIAKFVMIEEQRRAKQKRLVEDD